MSGSPDDAGVAAAGRIACPPRKRRNTAPCATAIACAMPRGSLCRSLGGRQVERRADGLFAPLAGAQPFAYGFAGHGRGSQAI
ncbi:MAG: hypothetical protein B7X91_04080 [Hydrogenophilales bacterium 17-64-11]|nr:MAG: hypothetical protein B7X91_04080 [Hydrogenophilales bacterium 17-64-11]